CPIRVVLLHYSPTSDTLHGEPEGIWTYLGCDRLATPIAEYRPDVVLHGHAHAGSFEGAIGTTPVYNVAVHVTGRDFYIFEREALMLTFPDGRVADGDVALGEEVTTDFYGRPVGGRYVEGPWTVELSRWAGRPLRLVQSPPGAAVDRGRGHISLISKSSLEELGRKAGHEGPVDGRRFRMLFELDGCGAREEDSWIKRHVRMGEALVRLRADVAAVQEDGDTASSRLTFQVDHLEQRVVRYAPGRSDAHTLEGRHELLYVVAGTGELELDGTPHPLEQGTAAFVAPGETYAVE